MPHGPASHASEIARKHKPATYALRPEGRRPKKMLNKNEQQRHGSCGIPHFSQTLRILRKSYFCSANSEQSCFVERGETRCSIARSVATSRYETSSWAEPNKKRQDKRQTRNAFQLKCV